MSNNMVATQNLYLAFDLMVILEMTCEILHGNRS
jgi:hypothetical protein